jgi:hypothetical protein
MQSRRTLSIALALGGLSTLGACKSALQGSAAQNGHNTTQLSSNAPVGSSAGDANPGTNSNIGAADSGSRAQGHLALTEPKLHDGVIGDSFLISIQASCATDQQIGVVATTDPGTGLATFPSTDTATGAAGDPNAQAGAFQQALQQGANASNPACQDIRQIVPYQPGAAMTFSNVPVGTHNVLVALVGADGVVKEFGSGTVQIASNQNAILDVTLIPFVQSGSVTINIQESGSPTVAAPVDPNLPSTDTSVGSGQIGTSDAVGAGSGPVTNP